LDRVAASAPWYRRWLDRLLPWRASHDRAVSDAMRFLAGELERERATRASERVELESRLQAASEAAAALATRHERLETFARALQSALHGLEFGLEEAQKAFSDKLALQERAVQRFSQSAEQNRHNIAAADRAIASLSLEAAGLARSYAELSASRAEHEDRLEEISRDAESASAGLRANLSRLDERMLAASSRTDAAEAALARGLMQLEDRLVGLLGRFEDSLRAQQDAARSMSARVETIAEEVALSPSGEVFQGFYLAFENRYRGTREEITRRQRVYLPYLAEAEALRSKPRASVRAVDIGCGRGEWLGLLGGEGYSAVGVDSNLRMVETCRGLGLNAEHGDGLAYLQGQPDHSVDVVSAFHVVEHLRFPLLLSLLREARRVLIPGGLIILETPNCNNVLTATQNFPNDPTHRLPIPPLLLSFAAEHMGFGSLVVHPLHPYGQEYHVDASLSVGRKFNDFFFGPQDYALIGRSA
jgi:O-antigen chain-terminating methyltransferase